MNDVVKLTLFVTNIANRELVWRAPREFFTVTFQLHLGVQVAALASEEIL